VEEIVTGDAPRRGTRLADAASGVTDEAGADAAKHYQVEQFAALVPLIGLQPPVRHHPAAGGGCQPGQFG
jgi:hypothetical protein